MSGVSATRCTVALPFAIIGMLLCDVRGLSVHTVKDTSLEDANKVLMKKKTAPPANAFHEDASAARTTDADGQQNLDGTSDAAGHSSGKSSRMKRAVGISGHGIFHNTEKMFMASDRSQSNSHLMTWQQAFKEDPALFAGCRSIFLDVGSNRGTHVRKLFEPQKYPGCKYLNVFDKGFGAAEKRAQPFEKTGICTFGFEANPRWTSTLQQLEKAYTAQGWRVKWFAPEAVSDNKGSVDFWDNDPDGTKYAQSDLGFSMSRQSANAAKVTVPEIDLAGFMEELHKNVPSGYRLMKMDIESAEFQVLPKFVTKHLLCKNVLDMITIEWHDRFLKTEASKQQAKQLESQVNSPNKCTSGPSTTVLALDDESYFNDGMPLPGHKQLQAPSYYD